MAGKGLGRKDQSGTFLSGFFTEEYGPKSKVKKKRKLSRQASGKGIETPSGRGPNHQDGPSTAKGHEERRLTQQRGEKEDAHSRSKKKGKLRDFYLGGKTPENQAVD